MDWFIPLRIGADGPDATLCFTLMAVRFRSITAKVKVLFLPSVISGTMVDRLVSTGWEIVARKDVDSDQFPGI